MQTITHHGIYFLLLSQGAIASPKTALAIGVAVANTPATVDAYKHIDPDIRG
jgi:hypothetical protein